MQATRFLLTHKDRQRYFELQRGQEVLVGRSLDAAFFLSAPSISRKHCLLRATTGGVEVVDLSSRKDCFVNGRRVVGAPVLDDGSVLQIGGLAFRFDVLDEQAATCAVCSGEFPLSRLSSVDGLKGGVCSSCLGSLRPSQQDLYESALTSEGFTVLESLGGMPPAFKVESSIGKVLLVLALPLVEGQDPAALQRVRDEARRLARLGHENVLPLYDIREVPEFLLLVMAYQEGETLDRRVAREGPFAPADAVAVGRACLLALSHAEGSGVSHRDLCPSNVIMTRAGSILVKGFSIASDLRALSLSLSSTGGEVAFVAPELFADGEAAAGPADLYGVGGVIYFALKGKSPYEGLSPAEFVWNVGIGDEPQLDIEGVPGPLADVLRALLALEADQRPPSSGAALAMLDDAWASIAARDANRIEGGFRGDELIEFLQLIDFQKKTGELEIQRQGSMTFLQGSLASARAGEREGRAAIRKLLAIREGHFCFRPAEPAQVDPGLRLNVGALLLDLARAVDESGDDWSALAD